MNLIFIDKEGFFFYNDYHFQNKFREKSMLATLPQKKIKICTGAGCSAWSAEVVTKKLETIRAQLEVEGYEIYLTQCMNRCGGGVSLSFPSCKNVFKLRDPEKVFDYVFQGQEEGALAKES
jgi:hypothetical protein